jgi:hypothetical protein
MYCVDDETVADRIALIFRLALTVLTVALNL